MFLLFDGSFLPADVCRQQVILRVASTFTWRPKLEDVVGNLKYRQILSYVRAQVDLHYPTHAPWCVMEKEKMDGKIITRVFLQIYRESGKQPMHLDNGLGWYDSPQGRWGALSLIVNINDGAATHIAPKPLTGVFANVRRQGKDRAASSAKAVQKILTQYETAFPPTGRRNRAGQMLAFHPGEQIHCGVGFDNSVDPVNPDFVGRVVLYLFLVPKSVAKTIWELSLFSAEFPWGLMRGGVKTLQVKSMKFVFLFGFGKKRRHNSTAT